MIRPFRPSDDFHSLTLSIFHTEKSSLSFPKNQKQFMHAYRCMSRFLLYFHSFLGGWGGRPCWSGSLKKTPKLDVCRTILFLVIRSLNWQTHIGSTRDSSLTGDHGALCREDGDNGDNGDNNSTTSGTATTATATRLLASAAHLDFEGALGACQVPEPLKVFSRSLDNVAAHVSHLSQ